MRWTAEELLRDLAYPLAGARPDPAPQLLARGNAAITGVTIDSRRVTAGSLFVPIVAKRDGHDFIATAIEHGAHAVLVSRQRMDVVDKIPNTVHVFVVDDTLDALSRLAAAQTKPATPRICITGSNGKTTTRAFVGAALATHFQRVQQTQGNFNNHLGVPLTLLSGPEDPDARVLEFGMSAPGENAHLARVFSPDIAIITSIALEHLETMGSLAQIAAAEAEPVSLLPIGGMVAIPANEPLLEEAILRLRPASDLTIVRVGQSSEADVHVEIDGIDDRSRGRIFFPNEPPISIALRVLGQHNLINAAYALVVGKHLGLPIAAMVRALEEVQSVGDRGRGLEWGSHRFIADCYNANPGSMRAALESLTWMRFGSKPSRSYAVLGDMLELGPTQDKLHAELASIAAAVRIDQLFGYGKIIEHAVNSAVAHGLSAEMLNSDPKIAAQRLREVLAADPRPATVLFKASRGIALERIVAELMQDAPQVDPNP